MADDDERPRDGAGAAGAGSSDAGQPDLDWTRASAPDDISELSRDIQAYRREQRAARRRARYGRFRLGPTAAPLALTVAALAIIAVVATLLTVMGPRNSASYSPLPLATTSVADGQLGGLLPDVTLSAADKTAVNLRSIRPAVIAVIPTGCGNCGDLVSDAARAASTKGFRLYAVEPPGEPADTDSLSGRPLVPASILTDNAATAVENAVEPIALTLVLVNRNGTIFGVEKSADSATVNALPANLLKMLENGG